MNARIDPDGRNEDVLNKLKCGVVCVHGIGNAGAERGHMPRQVAEAVAHGVTEVGGTYKELSNDLPRERVALGTRESPSVRALVELPATIPVEIAFYDGSWHRDTKAPGFWKVLLWAFKVLPIFPYILAGFWALDRESESEGESLSYGVAIGSLLIMFLGLLAVPFVGAFLILGTLVSLVSARVKTSLRHVIVSVLGDAYLYMSGELDGDDDSSIVNGLTRLAQSVRAQNGFTVLVGHSQGGEISRRISLKEDVDECVYVGTGEATLSMLRILRGSPILPVVLALSFVPFPALFAKAIGAMWASTREFIAVLFRDALGILKSLESGSTVTSSDPFEDFLGFLPYSVHELLWVLVFLTYAIVAGLVVRAVTRRPADLQKKSSAEAMYIRSPIDPVSFGTIAGAELRRYVPISASRPRLVSLAKEHVAYFSKWQTGAFIVESIVGTENLDMRMFERPKRFPLWVWVVATAAGILLAFGIYELGQAELSLFSRLLSMVMS